MLFPMPGFDMSINMITAFAFIIVLGIIVDDAIVVGESVFSAKEEQRRPNALDADTRATVRGVAKVIVPSVFGVLTTESRRFCRSRRCPGGWATCSDRSRWR